MDAERALVPVHFNPRSRKESDFESCAYVARYVIFQSTLSQGERPTMCLFDTCFCGFQSTLSQGERQVKVSKLPPEEMISIHALARRATKDTKDIVDRQVISIHALARRATQYRRVQGMVETYFNPRSRKESDYVITP